MATADRAVVVFVKEFQRPQLLKNGLIHLSTKKITAIFEVKMQLFPINLKCKKCFNKQFTRKTNKSNSDFSGGPHTTRPPVHMGGKI